MSSSLLNPRAVSALGDAELLDALRDRETERRRVYAEELRLIAEVEARGLAVERGCHIGVGARCARCST